MSLSRKIFNQGISTRISVVFARVANRWSTPAISTHALGVEAGIVV
ncbi:hypothetical protein [Microbispora triticiradicis]|nr:hypothetical protein [Microbispora triticiradicis]